MTSRTGGSPGADAAGSAESRRARARAGRSRAPGCARCRTHADRAFRAFTLIELLVVIVVIGLLASILTPVLFKARQKAKEQWARKEIGELGGAIAMYHQDQVAYPPDTKDWGPLGGNNETDMGHKKDVRSLHRYLGSTIRDARGEEFQPYMSMDYKRLVDVDADGVGSFTDPFECPYELDAMHMVPPDPEKPGSGWTQCGWPYRLQTKDTPTPQEKQAMVDDFKFVSYGADSDSADYPFDPEPSDTKIARTRDDIRSWE